MESATSKLIIRPAERADVPALVVMTVEFETFLHGLNGATTPQRPIPQTAATFETLAFGSKKCFSCEIALLQDEPAGFLSHFLGYDSDHGARSLFIPDLFVRDFVRGGGVGRALMQEAAQIARRQEATLIRWSVWSRNPAAIAFYEGLGAKYDREEICAYWPAADWPKAPWL